MDISLAQFRAQVGVQNYGEVIVTGDNKLKTVNNGIFARNFKMFHKDVSQDQACRAAVQFYNAIKNDFGKAADNASVKQFLNSTAKKLGVKDANGTVNGIENTPVLDRITIKTVLQRLDTFKKLLSRGLKKDLRDAIFKTAGEAYVLLDKKYDGSVAVKNLVDKCPGGFIKSTVKDEHGKEKVECTNRDQAIDFLKGVIELQESEEIAIDEKKSYRDSWVNTTKDLINDFEQLCKLSDSELAIYETVDEMVNGLQDSNKVQLKSEKAANYLKGARVGIDELNRILSDRKELGALTRYLRTQITTGGQKCFGDKSFECRLSDAELKRVILRQFSRAVANFAKVYDSSWDILHEKDINYTRGKIAGCISGGLTSNDYETLFNRRAKGQD